MRSEKLAMVVLCNNHHENIRSSQLEIEKGPQTFLYQTTQKYFIQTHFSALKINWKLGKDGFSFSFFADCSFVSVKA